MFDNEPSPWSAEALFNLKCFLNAYTANLEGKVWCRRYHYIDAFSGAAANTEVESQVRSIESDFLVAIAEYGQHQPEHVEFTRYSPITAVEITRPFKSYTFIEHSLGRNQPLETISKEFQRLKIRVVRESCSLYLRRLALRTEWKSQRALLFLDPFRMQINWETLVLLAQTKAIEIMLNFPVGIALQRKLPHDSEKITSARRNCLDRFFGSTEWFQILYSARTTGELYQAHERPRTGTMPALLTNAIRTTDPGRRLVAWYHQRLETIFGAVSKPFLVRNNNQGQLYYLMFAAHKESSLSIAQSFLDLGAPED